MKKIKIKAPAKVNLTLDVLGKNEKFHQIKSLMASIDLSDEIIVKKRNDDKINLKMKGLKVDCLPIDNNAYKAAKLFMATFSTKGADIIIKKRIPIGAGLGGSSADIAGVLNALKKLYQIDCDLIPLASTLGSDSAFMINGGWAIAEQKGDEISQKEIDKKLFFIILTDKRAISARESYNEFDAQDKNYPPCTDIALSALMNDDKVAFLRSIKNDLYFASSKLNENIEKNINILNNIDAPASIMAGSGSAVLAIFFDKDERDKAYKKLKKMTKEKIIKAQTF